MNEANPFDAFDEENGAVTTMAPPDGGNPFDQFDAAANPFDEFDQEAPTDTGQSRVSSGLNAAGRGFGSAITDAVSGLGQLSQFAVRNLNPVGWAAKAGFEPAQQAVDLYSKPGEFVEELGQSGTDAVTEALPVNPAHEKEWLANKIPGAVGQMAGMAVPALLTGGASLAPTAVRLATWLPRIQGGLLGLNSGYAEADRQGITDQAQRDALALSFGAAEAGTEMLGGLGSAEFTKRLLGHAVAKGGQEGAEGFLKRFIKTAATEGLEEPAAGELQDIAANIFGGGEGEAPPSLSIADPAMWQRRGEEAALGSIAASPLALADAALEARRSNNPSPAPPPSSSPSEPEAPANEGATDAEFAALSRATTSAEAAGMTQTAQALRDLAAQAQAQKEARKVAPVAADVTPTAPVEEAPTPLAPVGNEIPPPSAADNENGGEITIPAEPIIPEAPPVADPFVEVPVETAPPAPEGIVEPPLVEEPQPPDSPEVPYGTMEAPQPPAPSLEIPFVAESPVTEEPAQTEAIPINLDAVAPPILTPEAESILAQVDAGGAAPAFVSANLERIAKENGVEVTGSMRPVDVLDALRAKKAVEPTAPNPFPAPEVETPLPPVAAAAESIAESPAVSETVPPVDISAANPFAGTEQAPDLKAARAAATRPNAPDSTSEARPLKDELGGAAQDYTAFTDADMQRRAVEVVDAIGSVENMARLLSSEDGVRSLGVDPALQTYVLSETIKRADAAVNSATNDVDRILANQTLRKVRAIWDVTRTEGGQALVASKLAGASMRDAIPAMSVDTAIEKQQKSTIDVALPVEPVTAAIKQSAADAGALAADELALKIEADERVAAPSAPADQAAKIAVLQAQIDAYFEGNTPKRVRVIYDPKGESEAQLNKGVIEINAAAVGDVTTADVARLLEHEIGHELFKDPAMRDQFNALWKSLDPLERAAIENEVAERYSAAERNEEASVRALDAIRAATRSPKAQSAWEKFKAAVARLWQKFTGSMPKDPEALAARMIEVGVQRMRADRAGDGLAMSKRTDLLKNRSPDLAKLLNVLRGKIKPGAKWKDIFTGLPSEQQKWEQEVYDRIRKHEALQDLTPEESQQLTRELSNAWQRERNRLFQQELKKQLAKVAGVKPQAAKKVSTAAPRLLQLINLGALDSAAFRDAVAQEWGIANLNSVEAKRLKDLGTRAQQAPEGVPRRKLEQQFVNGLQDLTKLTKLEILENWWTASVLSGWRTHTDILLGVANGIEDVGLGAIVTAFRTGNADVAFRAVGKVIANLPAAIQEALHHLVTGDRSMMRNYDAEVQAALQDGHKMMSNAGRDLIRQGGLYKAPGAFMQLIGRMLTAWDHINSTSTYEGAKMMALARHPELYQQALRIGPRERANARAQARAELTVGAEPQTKAERLQENARVKEILDAEIPTEIIAQASEIGRDAALQGEPTGTGWLVWWLSQNIGKAPGMIADAMEKKGVENMAGKLVLAALRRASTVSRVLAGSKFVRTAAHALNRQISYVPGIGLLRFSEGTMQGAKQDILIAKQLLGTAVGLSLLAAFRAKDDDEEGIEGSWKGLTPQQRSALYSQGKQPNTVWYRDSKGRVVSFNFNQWGIAGVLGTIGAMEDQRRYKGNDSDLSILVNGIVQGSMQFTEKAQLQGLQQIFGDSAYSTSSNVTGGLAKRLNRYAATTVGGIVPRIAKDVDAVVSPELRSTSQWYEQWAAQVPMLRELSSGKRVDILGQDVTIDRSPLSRVTQTGTADGAYRILGRLNERDLWLPDPTSGVRVVKDPNGERRDMSLVEKDHYQRATGAAYRAFVIERGPEILAMEHKAAQDYITRQTKVLRDQAAVQATR